MALTRKQLRKEHRGQFEVQTGLFLERLVRARKDVKLLQGEVAGALGRDQSFISKLESGKRRTDFVLLEQLAVIYRKPLMFFATREQLKQLHPGMSFPSPTQKAALPDHYFRSRTLT